MSNRVYEYGLLPPTSGREVVLEQMRLARKYQNALVEVERRRRDAAHAAEADDPKVLRLRTLLGALERRLERIRTGIKARSIRERRKINRKEATAWTLASLKAVKELHRNACAAARGQMLDRLTAFASTAAAERRAARAVCGLYSATYQIVEQAVDAGAKAAMKESTAAEPVMPHFHRFDGAGRIAVGRNGSSLGDIVGGDDLRARIEPVSPEAWQYQADGSPWVQRRRGDRERLSRTMLHHRAQSDEKGKPVWATFPMTMHRPLPAGAEVQWVVVIRRLIADREQWVVQVTVNLAKEPEASTAPGLAVAVDLGWRGRDTGGTRVGYWIGTDGREGEIQADADVARALRKSDDLRSIRDKMFDKAKDLLAAWLAKTAAPEWMAPMVAYLDKWRSHSRMARLVKLWRKQPEPERSQPIAQWLLWWYMEDRHLWQWEASGRHRALLRRREGYRLFAFQLAQEYRILIIEGKDKTKRQSMDLRPMTKLAPPEEVDKLPAAARAKRQDASPSEARQCLTGAFTAGGGETLKEPCAWSTRDCAFDGHRNEWPDQSPLDLRCAGPCGEVWDQDRNAARNLLRAGTTSLGAPRPLAAKKPGRCERLRAAKVKKLAAARTQETAARAIEANAAQ
jgi:hypothetical protein